MTGATTSVASRRGWAVSAHAMIVSEQTYELTDPRVDSQVVNLKRNGATAFFDVTSPKFAAQAIKKAYELGWGPLLFLNYVAASPAWILPAGQEACRGLISASYGKLAADPQWDSDPGMREDRAWMKKYYPGGDFRDEAHTYASMVLQTLLHVLDTAGAGLTRASSMRQATADFPAGYTGSTVRGWRYGPPAPRRAPPVTSDPRSGIRPGVQLLRVEPMRWLATPKSMLTRAGTEKMVSAVMNCRSAG